MADITIYEPDGTPLRVISDPLRAHLVRQMIKYAVQKTIFCPVSGLVLDMRTCVAFIDAEDGVQGVMSPEAWATETVQDAWRATAPQFPGIGVYSGRKRSLALPTARA